MRYLDNQIKYLSHRFNKKPEKIKEIVKFIGGKYWKWVLIQWAKNNVRFPEDELRVKNALDNFKKFKNRLLNRDINFYPTVNSLESIIEELTNSKKQLDRVKLDIDGVRIINEYKDYTVVEIFDVEALMDLGEGTRWCTRRSYPACAAKSYLDYYGKVTLVLYAGRPLFQYTPDLFQILDVNDESFVNIPQIVKGIEDGSLKLFELIHPDYDLIIKNLTAKNTVYYQDTDILLRDEQVTILEELSNFLFDLHASSQYAVFEYRLLCRWRGKEKKLLKWCSRDPHLRSKYLVDYAILVKNVNDSKTDLCNRVRWTDAEKVILEGPVDHAIRYAGFFGGWSELKNILINNAKNIHPDTNAVSYAVDYVASVTPRKRWHELEELFKELYNNRNKYRLNQSLLMDRIERYKRAIRK